MSFLRYGEIYPCDEGAISRPRPRSSPWMSLQLAIPGRLLSSRARFRFTSRSYTAHHQPRPTTLRQRTAQCNLTDCLSRGVQSIYVLSTFGQKIEWMRSNPKVCIQVDEIANQSQWVSVVVNGVYEELPEPQYATERAHARTLLQKRYRWWVNALAERQAKANEVMIKPIFFRIRISSMTGLRAEEEGTTIGKLTYA